MNYWKIGSKILILNGPKKGGAYTKNSTILEFITTIKNTQPQRPSKVTDSKILP